ncbi:MAG: hypothetical protein JXB10_11365 [Pirellulales bacterium]|nr:hypothetical protein [Pirellulales bacterium]
MAVLSERRSCTILVWAVFLSLAVRGIYGSDKVLPCRPPEQKNPKIRAVQDRIYRAVELQAHHLLMIVHPWAEDSKLLLLTQSKGGEHWIRPNTSTVEGLAFLYRFGPYDEKLVGVSREDLFRKTIVPMMRYLVTTHVTGARPTSDGKPWGDQWQSALWTQSLGRAAWWTWADLPEDLRQGVRRVAAHEADRFVGRTPPHQLRQDTKAEENAWNSTILNVAVLLMPSDPRRAAWEKEFQRWALSSFLRPADERNPQIVDGRPVSEQFTGANIFDDFTLENHRIVHPDYMATFELLLQSAVDYSLTGRRTPEALLFNLPGIYENLKWMILPEGGFVYPNGQDWELFRLPKWMSNHAFMAVYGRDPDAWALLQSNLETTEKMQARNPDGAIFHAKENFFASNQADLLRWLGCNWLALQAAKDIVDRPVPRLGVKRLEAGKIILHRTPAAVHTLSWGATVMAQCVPFQLDRVVSPDKRSGVGHIRFEGVKGDAPVLLRSAEVADRADGFTADLVLDHGREGVRAELRFESSADGTLTMREKLTAIKDLTTDEIATGLIGVLNDAYWIYESGSRKIAMDGRVTDVPALSGKRIEGSGARRIVVDGALEITSPQPLKARYAGTKEIVRGRATDELYLNYLGGRRSWKKGEVISQYEARLRPVENREKGDKEPEPSKKTAGRPKRFPVSGRVLIDGKPLEVGFIQVLPKGNRVATGALGRGGRFTLTTFTENDGCVPGKHYIAILAVKSLSPTKMKWFAPKKYSTVATSGLILEVSGPRNNVEIHLTWKGSGHKKPFIERQEE